MFLFSSWRTFVDEDLLYFHPSCTQLVVWVDYQSMLFLRAAQLFQQMAAFGEEGVHTLIIVLFDSVLQKPTFPPLFLFVFIAMSPESLPCYLFSFRINTLQTAYTSCVLTFKFILSSWGSFLQGFFSSVFTPTAGSLFLRVTSLRIFCFLLSVFSQPVPVLLAKVCGRNLKNSSVDS